MLHHTTPTDTVRVQSCNIYVYKKAGKCIVYGSITMNTTQTTTAIWAVNMASALSDYPKTLANEVSNTNSVVCAEGTATISAGICLQINSNNAFGIIIKNPSVVSGATVIVYAEYTIA